MQAKTKSPVVFGDAAALRVTIRKAPGSNGGSVALLLANMFGAQSTQAIQASAVAVVSFPGTVDTNTTFPTAINNCMFDVFWDRTTGLPKIDPATGAPYVFRIGSSYHYGACDSGQWTSLLQDVNDVPAIRDLIDYGNPDPLSLGQEIWIQPGTKSTIYDAVVIPDSAVFPVVRDVSSSTHDHSPILGFAPFVITGVDKGAKYIEGHFAVGVEVPRSTGGGQFYGTVVPPSLAQ
jgi:hypothetical protein